MWEAAPDALPNITVLQRTSTRAVSCPSIFQKAAALPNRLMVSATGSCQSIAVNHGNLESLKFKSIVTFRPPGGR